MTEHEHHSHGHRHDKKEEADTPQTGGNATSGTSTNAPADQVGSQGAAAPSSQEAQPVAAEAPAPTPVSDAPDLPASGDEEEEDDE
jgi:hypothetical protein